MLVGFEYGNSAIGLIASPHGEKAENDYGITDRASCFGDTCGSRGLGVNRGRVAPNAALNSGLSESGFKFGILFASEITVGHFDHIF